MRRNVEVAAVIAALEKAPLILLSIDKGDYQRSYGTDF